MRDYDAARAELLAELHRLNDHLDHCKSRWDSVMATAGICFLIGMCLAVSH